MKKVININFQGRVVMIEEEAYENLKTYIESLRKHFAGEEGCDEIINDIENRISELFAEVIRKGSPCVSEDDLAAIIKSIGRPEDFDGEENANASSQSQSSESQSQQGFQQTDVNGQKQFFRDETHKKIGGVCAGIANYFNIDVTWVRLIALVLLCTYGISFVVYIILWIALPSSATQTIGSSQKRLYRDLSHKTIGGVCAGLANYFNVNIWIPKVIFLAGAFCSLPVSIITQWWHGAFFPGVNGFFITTYIILWAVVPAAVTASEKLSMKGENVDLNSIKNTVQEDLSDSKKNKKKVNNYTAVNTNNSPEMIPVKDHSTFGNIIITLLKVFAYFVLGCILLSVICGLGGIGIAAFGLLPFKGYIIGGAWQSSLFILTILLGIWLPVIGIIIWIIRSITGAKPNRYLRISLWVLWMVGVMSFAGLAVSVHNDISETNKPVTQAVTLANPKVQEMYINYERMERPFRFGRHWMFGRSSYNSANVSIRRGKLIISNSANSVLIDSTNVSIQRGNFVIDNSVPSIEDSVLISNTDIQFIKSANDSFEVYVTKLSNGSSVQNADALAQKINYTGISQQDTALTVPSYFAINQTDKFRNQFVLVTIAVPAGKKIIVHQNEGFSNKIFLGFLSVSDYGNPFDIQGFDWDFDREYIMTKDGLKPTHTDNDDNDNDDNSSTQDSATQEKVNKIQEKLNEEKRKLNEQNERKKQQLQEQLQKIKSDSEKINAANIKFQSPVELIGKVFMKMI